MNTSRIKFLIAMMIAGASTVTMGLANRNMLSLDSSMVITLIVGSVFAGMGFLLFRMRSRLRFVLQWRNRQFDVKEERYKELLGFRSFTTYDTLIVLDPVKGSKKIGMSFILITKLPYMIQEMDEEQQLHITSSFARLLGTFNHPFTYMPMCRPVDRKRFADKISDRIRHINLVKAVSKAPVDERLLIEQKVLQKQLERLSQGESPMEVVYLVQLKESGNGIDEIRQKLEVNVQAMTRNLQVIHQVSARRLTGMEIVEAFHEFFLLEA